MIAWGNRPYGCGVLLGVTAATERLLAVVSFLQGAVRSWQSTLSAVGGGTRGTTQDAIRRYRADECGSRFQYNDSMSFEEMDERLSKPRSWDFVVIDSFQYTQMSYKEYIAFKERHRNKLLIFVSHADGKRPDGRAAIKSDVRRFAENLGRRLQSLQ